MLRQKNERAWCVLKGDICDVARVEDLHVGERVGAETGGK